MLLHPVRGVCTVQLSAAREVCPQEGKGDPVIEMIWSGGLRPLPTCIFSGVEAPLPSSFVSVAIN